MRAIRRVESDNRDREMDFGGEISGIRVFFWNLRRIEDERVAETLERTAGMVAGRIGEGLWGLQRVYVRGNCKWDLYYLIICKLNPAVVFL